MEFGKIEYKCAGEKRGREKDFRTLNLTLIGLEDIDLLEKKGVRELRLGRIRRLTREAADQGCLLGYEDLSTLLLTSLATLKRDISYLDAIGCEISLRGRRKNGRKTYGEFEGADDMIVLEAGRAGVVAE